MNEQQRPMPPMSGNQRPDYQRMLEDGKSPESNLPKGLPNLSPEDQALLKDCNRIATIQRAIPTSVLFAGSVFLASHKGYIKNGVKVKAFGAGLFGYLFGRLSYQTTMMDRFLRELPNSEISQLIRKQRGLPEPEGNILIPAHENDMSYFQSNPDVPIVDNPIVGNEHKNSKFGVTSYDQLREQHQKRYPVQKSSMEPGFYVPEHELAKLEQQKPIWQQTAINQQEEDVPHSSNTTAIVFRLSDLL